MDGIGWTVRHRQANHRSVNHRSVNGSVCSRSDCSPFTWLVGRVGRSVGCSRVAAENQHRCVGSLMSAGARSVLWPGALPLELLLTQAQVLLRVGSVELEVAPALVLLRAALGLHSLVVAARLLRHVCVVPALHVRPTTRAPPREVLRSHLRILRSAANTHTCKTVDPAFRVVCHVAHLSLL